MKTLTTWSVLCLLLCAFQFPARAQDESTAHVTRIQQLFPDASDFYPHGIPPDRVPSNTGFGDQVVRSGNTTLVSLIDFDGRIGRVAIFTRNSDGVWERTGSIDDPDAQPDGRFGASIALDEHAALVTSTQALYVYRRGRSGFTLIQRLRATDTRNFGAGALWHGWAFVPTTDHGERFVRVYFFTPRGLLPLQKLRGNGPSDDGFPGDLAVADGNLIVGAPTDDEGRGAAYLFEQHGLFWIKRQKLIAMNPTPGDHFGNAVGVGSGTIAIGAPDVRIPATGFGCGSNSTPFYSGFVYVFGKARHLWAERQALPAPECVFQYGANVAADGAWIAATMPGEGLEQSTTAVVYHREDGGFVVVGSVGATNLLIPSLDLQSRTLLVGLHDERNLENFDLGEVDVARLDESAP